MADCYSQQALFDQQATGAEDTLASMIWPDASRFPLNTNGRSVEQTVLADLRQSRNPLIVGGFASLGTPGDFLAVAWRVGYPLGAARGGSDARAWH